MMAANRHCFSTSNKREKRDVLGSFGGQQVNEKDPKYGANEKKEKKKRKRKR
jgi:hypothetical protein